MIRIKIERRPDCPPLWSVEFWSQAVVIGLLAAMFGFAVPMIVVHVLGYRIGW